MAPLPDGAALLPDGLLQLDGALQVVAYKPSHDGFTGEAAFAVGPLSALPLRPASLVQLTAACEAARHSGAVSSAHLEVVGPSGTVQAWLEARAFSCGSGVQVLLRDIGEYVLADRRRAAAEERTHALLAAIPDIILRVTDLGMLLDCHVKYPRGAALSPEERRRFEAGLSNWITRELRLIQRAISTRTVQTTEFSMTLDGRSWHFEGRFVRSGPEEACCIVRDTTRQKEAEAELIAAREEALEASRAKSRFLAHMSHEIRTPMNGVLGMAQLILRTSLTDEQRRYLEMLSSSADSLLAIINEILDLSKIEANRCELEEAPYDPAALLQSVVAPLQPVAERKVLRLTLWLPELPPRVLGDATRTRQVVTNLVSNALKFTAEGEVSVSVSRPDAGTVEIQVQDTGIGIAPERLEAIFEAFVQADCSTTRRFGGTGLGLSITQQLVELMGGSISVDSVVGAGSRFTVRLPLRPAALPVAARSAPQPEPVTALRILVAEDHPVNQLLVRRLLENEGHTVTIASDGREAVQRVGAERFDVVLMDISMPEMDGLEATTRIRGQEPDGERIPIVALTAHAMSGDAQRCIDVGMDAYLTKPINTARLRETLSGLLAS